MSHQSAPAASQDGFTHANGLPAIPIVLGVVGHRDVPDDDKVRQALTATLTSVFQEFRKAYPHTPLVLLSSLAQGSDQLAADAALKNGVFVRAPLPFPADVFRQSTSFDTDKERDKLDDFLKQGVETFVVPLPENKVSAATDWQAVASDRNDPAHIKLRHMCYANAGGFIVRYCHALIALWDGLPGRASGTAEHVKFKLQGQAPDDYPWTDAEPLGFRGDRGPVCVIHTPRAGQPTNKASAMEIRLPDDKEPYGKPIAPQPLASCVRAWRLLWRIQSALGVGHLFAKSAAKGKVPYPAELRQFHEVCQSVDDFNRDIGAKKTAKAAAKTLKKIHAQAPAGVAFDAQYLRWFSRLCGVRDAAGLLSRKYQPRLDFLHGVVFVLLGLSVGVFHVYAHHFDYDPPMKHTLHYPFLLLFFAGFLSAASLVVLLVWWRRMDERRLDYRALAEALRVRRAWALGGIGESVANSYQGQLRSEMSWVRRALLDVCPPAQLWATPFAQLPQSQQRVVLDKLKNEWVIGQANHYEKNHKKHKWWAEKLRLCGLILAMAGWLLIIALLGLSLFEMAGVSITTEVAPWTAKYPPHEILLASGLLVILGGLCIAYCERRSHEDLAKQYDRMFVVFRNGKYELERRLANDDIVGAQAVLKALGREAITEHAQWLILRRARPFELHIGG